MSGLQTLLDPQGTDLPNLTLPTAHPQPPGLTPQTHTNPGSSSSTGIFKTPQFSAQMKTFNFFFHPDNVTLPLACLEVTLLSEASSFSPPWAPPAHHRHHLLLFAASHLPPAKIEEIKKAYKPFFFPLLHNFSDGLEGTCSLLKGAQTSCTACEKQGINRGITSHPTSEPNFTRTMH